MLWNAQVVFRATFVTTRGAIIDLYTATLKRGTQGLDAKFFIIYTGQGKLRPGRGPMGGKLRPGRGRFTIEN